MHVQALLTAEGSSMRGMSSIAGAEARRACSAGPTRGGARTKADTRPAVAKSASMIS